MDDFDAELDDQEKRIAAILNEAEPPEVSDETLDIYQTYLKAHLKLPCLLTGIEDFDWEEYYVFGPGNKKEYETLKKTRPSYKDTFKFIEFCDETDETYGLLVNVKRLSDNRKFTLPFADLESADKKSGNSQLINDYVVWFVNNG